MPDFVRPHEVAAAVLTVRNALEDHWPWGRDLLPPTRPDVLMERELWWGWRARVMDQILQFAISAPLMTFEELTQEKDELLAMIERRAFVVMRFLVEGQGD